MKSLGLKGVGEVKKPRNSFHQHTFRGNLKHAVRGDKLA